MNMLITDSNNEQVMIAFRNSDDELEYSVFVLEDGGVITTETSMDKALQELLEELDFDVDMKYRLGLQ